MTTFTLKTNSSNMTGWLGEDGYFENERFSLFIARDRFAVLTNKETKEVETSCHWFGDIIEFPSAEICVSQWEATLTVRSYDLRIKLVEVKKNKAYGVIIYERFAIIPDEQMPHQFLEWMVPIKDSFDIRYMQDGSAIKILSFSEGTKSNNKPRIREAIEQRIASYLWG